MRQRTLFALTFPAILTLALLLVASPAMAQLKTFTVFPFDYMGPEKFQHYGKGASSRIKHKLTLPGKLEPAEDSVIKAIGLTPPSDSTQARSMLSGSGADYLVWGNVSIAGNKVNVEVLMQGLKTDPIMKSSEVPLDEVTLELDKLAQELTQELFAEVQTGGQETQKGQGTLAASANPAFLAANSPESDGVVASNVNPQFRYEGGAQNTGRWQSQGLRFASRSMAIGDGDGDGKNEIFLLTDRHLRAYRITQGRLDPITEVEFSHRAELINVSLIDINKDGGKEVIVSTYRDKAPLSYVYRYNANGFTPVAEKIRMFLNVVKMPPMYAPTLIGQKKGSVNMMDSGDVYEVYISGDGAITGKRVNVPPFGNVFNIGYMPEGKTYKLLLVDGYGRIKIFTQELEPDSSTDETYNSSAIPLELPTAIVPGMGSSRDIYEEDYYYIPIKMLITNKMTGSDKYEVLLNKDISVAAQFFKRFRTFTQGEIHGLFWDGTGLNLSWKTRRIKGTVVSYDIADYNNDGKDDLCVLVNTYPGAISMQHRKTVLFAYDLNL